MVDERLEEFARALVGARDRAVRACVAQADHGRSPIHARWDEVGFLALGETAVRGVIADVVDDALFAVLSAIDQEVLHLVYVPSSGEAIDLVTEGFGELGGEYSGPGGWVERYSTETYHDDLSPSGDGET